MTKGKASPVFETAQEHDIYMLGLVCGTIGALQGWCESPSLVGVEQVDEVIVSLSAFLENALEFGEKSFEDRLKEELGGTRVAIEALMAAWEKGYKNGLLVKPGPMPTLKKKELKNKE